VVLRAHPFAMHDSFARIRKTVIFYHVLIRVLGNDKRFSGELPASVCFARKVGILLANPSLSP
jgi:hypothetical protein